MTRTPENARPPRRSTIVTLSQLAGVAPSTITRALRGDSRISEATRTRIRMLAQEHGYTPNALARTLSSGRSGLYGLVLGEMSNPIYRVIMEAAAREADRVGARLLLLHVGAGEMEAKTAEALLQYQVDGCIISSAELNSPAAEICRTHSVPLVMVNRVARQHGCFVSCDNRNGGAHIAERLIAKGYSRLAVVHPRSASSTGREREAGFTDALLAAGLPPPLRVMGGPSWDDGYAAGLEIADMPESERPQAVFGLSDILAMGVIDALVGRGFRIPRDMAVAGFDGLPEGARVMYDLMTIEQPVDLMMRRTFELLQARLDEPGLPDEQVTLAGRLIERGSAG